MLRSLVMTRRLAALVLSFALVACVTFAENLRRGAAHHDSERWNQALAVWLEIEADAPMQSRAERGEYLAYRGLTHLRMGARADARHHFALAHQFWAALPSDLRRRVEEAERELGGASR
jgi:hypothetical protein